MEANAMELVIVDQMKESISVKERLLADATTRGDSSGMIRQAIPPSFGGPPQ